MSDRRKSRSNRQKEDYRQPVPGDSSARDQRERRYYYDDAHGYEEFDPEAELDEEDEDETAS